MSDLSLTVILHNAEQAAMAIRNVAAPKCREIWATGQLVEATFRTHEDAKTDRQRVSTEDLGVKGYSQLIDRVSAFAATELGVTFPATFQQWEGMQVDPDTGKVCDNQS